MERPWSTRKLPLHPLHLTKEEEEEEEKGTSLKTNHTVTPASS
jgi:hypothetical protein